MNDVQLIEEIPGDIQAIGDVGGDWQASEAYGRRYVAQLPNGLYAVADVNFYIEDDTDDELMSERFKEGRRLTQQTMVCICRDKDDPGSTEVASDYEYESLPAPEGDNDDVAHQAAVDFPAGPLLLPERLRPMLDD